GRARGLDRTALVDRDGGEDAVDALDARTFHAVEELPGIGGEALDVAPLSFGIEHVERETRFSRSGHAGDDREASEGDVNLDPLQGVLASADDMDALDRGGGRNGGHARTSEYIGDVCLRKRRVPERRDQRAPQASRGAGTPGGTSVRPESRR